jgi:hypothetical protein
MDPYFSIASSNNFVDYFEDGWKDLIPVLIEIKPTENKVALQWIANFSQSELDFDPIHFELSKVQFFTARISKTAYQLLTKDPKVVKIELASPLRIMRAKKSQAHSTIGTSKKIPCSKTQFLLGFIDDGCPFAHQDLMQDDKVRFTAIWDQDSKPDFKSSATKASPPKGWSFGHQIDASKLNAAASKLQEHGRTNERSIYSKINNSRVQQRISHGAHVLGLAAGSKISRSILDLAPPYNPPTDDPQTKAYEADLAFVQLPRATYQAPTRGSLAYTIYNGVKWIEKVGCDAKNIVTVIDYGSYLGPHNGESLFERALDQVIGNSQQKMKVVFPSGNALEHRATAQIPKIGKEKKPSQWHWWIPPENEVATFQEIWFDKFVPENTKISLKCTSPNGSDEIEVKPGDQKSIGTNNGKYLSVWFCPKGTHILVRVAATRSDDKNYPIAPSGRWKFALSAEPEKTKPSVVGAWVYANRGGRSINALPRSRRSHLIPMDKSVIVDGRGSMIGMACSTSSTVLGGVNQSATRRYGSTLAPAYENDFAAFYSGAGPGRGGVRKDRGPDGCAITEESSSLRGIASIGNYSGSTWRMQGTSTAPPQYARFLSNSQSDTVKVPVFNGQVSLRLGEFIIPSPGAR